MVKVLKLQDIQIVDFPCSCFISTVDEGLAGINDMGMNSDEILFAPKFPVTLLPKGKGCTKGEH